MSGYYLFQMNATFETQKRVEIAKELVGSWQKTKGVILAGSVAYSPNLHVTSESDLDLIVIHDDIKQVIPILNISDQDKNALAIRTFEGYSVKSTLKGVPISLHILNQDCFDLITRCYVADIRLYRSATRKREYDLFGYSGQKYSYQVRNIFLNDLSGARTIVPVYFIFDDRHYLGIHRDKLMSSPVILHDPKGQIKIGIEVLWKKVVQDVKSEQVRFDKNASVVNALSRKRKFTPEVLEEIDSMQHFYLSQI
jgi:hypothetical protein